MVVNENAKSIFYDVEAIFVFSKTQSYSKKRLAKSKLHAWVRPDIKQNQPRELQISNITKTEICVRLTQSGNKVSQA